MGLNKYERKLSQSFYHSNDVVSISKQLLGKYLCTNLEGVLTVGKIVETEAYCGATDKACHAYLGKNTNRTKVMFEEGGRAYIYMCYGIHHLFNIVTNKQGYADAVLIRAVEPVYNIDIMLARRKRNKLDYKLTSGPGKLSQALGLKKELNNTDLFGNTIWVSPNENITEDQIIATPRIGIDYAEEDALLPWRFIIKNNKWCSK